VGELMNDLMILVAVFVAVLIGSYTVVSNLARLRAVRRNIEAAGSPVVFEHRHEQLLDQESAIIRHYFDVQKKNDPECLEMRLIRAGFFRKSAKRLYILVRFLITAGVFGATWSTIAALSATVTPLLIFLFSAIIAGIAFILVNAVLDKMAQSNQTNYRRLFPDFMDLLIICVDAGLSVEAAIDRVAREFAQTKPSFGHHLTIIGLEVRAGRPIHEALAGFSSRVKVEEAKSLSTLFRQSQELGSSVTRTLRVFSKEMRQMRLIHAEEKANSLPIKMLFPLAAFLFPVNLVIVLVPVMIQIMSMFSILNPTGL
jgi:tight adherence protein C